MVSDDEKSDYRQAFADWQTQLTALHAAVLDGDRLDPVKLKALLNRESRAKARYDGARKKLLGIES